MNIGSETSRQVKLDENVSIVMRYVYLACSGPRSDDPRTHGCGLRFLGAVFGFWPILDAAFGFWPILNSVCGFGNPYNPPPLEIMWKP